MMSEPSVDPQKPRATPLWVISLFVTLTETAMVIAATQTTGNLQLAFAYFSMGFAVLVFICFMLILWSKPEVLHPPESFGHGGTTPAEYVKALTIRNKVKNEIVAAIKGVDKKE